MDPKTDWKIEWILRFILLIFLVLAVVGIFGGWRDPHRRSASTDGLRTTVEHWPAMRLGPAKDVIVRVRNSGDRRAEGVRLRLNRDYMTAFSLQSIVPQPENESEESGHLELMFGALDPGDEMEIKIDLDPQRWGRYKARIEATLVGVGARPSVFTFTTTVFP